MYEQPPLEGFPLLDRSATGMTPDVSTPILRLIRLSDWTQPCPFCLDEEVEEAAHHRASRRYGNDDDPTLSDDEAFDWLHDEADRESAAANAGGLPSQLEYLIQRRWTETDLVALLASSSRCADHHDPSL